MLTRIANAVTVSLNVPSKTEYWCGFDTFVECALANDYLSPEEYASMTDAERRGYEAGARHQADLREGPSGIGRPLSHLVQ